MPPPGLSPGPPPPRASTDHGQCYVQQAITKWITHKPQDTQELLRGVFPPEEIELQMCPVKTEPVIPVLLAPISCFQHPLASKNHDLFPSAGTLLCSGMANSRSQGPRWRSQEKEDDPELTPPGLPTGSLSQPLHATDTVCLCVFTPPSPFAYEGGSPVPFPFYRCSLLINRPQPQANQPKTCRYPAN
jgi:hypothetical protein